MFVEQGDRLRLKRLSLQGTGGQCLMGPPDFVDGRMPYRLYNLGGVLANMLVALIAAAFFFVLQTGLAATFLAFVALFGLAFALANGLPLTVGGVNNDGKNLRSASESPEALRAFWTILKVGEAQADDLRAVSYTHLVPNERSAMTSVAGLPQMSESGAKFRLKPRSHR